MLHASFFGQKPWTKRGSPVRCGKLWGHVKLFEWEIRSLKKMIGFGYGKRAMYESTARTSRMNDNWIRADRYHLHVFERGLDCTEKWNELVTESRNEGCWRNLCRVLLASSWSSTRSTGWWTVLILISDWKVYKNPNKGLNWCDFAQDFCLHFYRKSVKITPVEIRARLRGSLQISEMLVTGPNVSFPAFFHFFIFWFWFWFFWEVCRLVRRRGITSNIFQIIFRQIFWKSFPYVWSNVFLRPISRIRGNSADLATPSNRWWRPPDWNNKDFGQCYYSGVFPYGCRTCKKTTKNLICGYGGTGRRTRFIERCEFVGICKGRHFSASGRVSKLVADNSKTSQTP